MNALVVVAHPDDELIWMGGYIIRNPGWNWTAIAMCRRSDPDRNPKFYNVCKLLRVRNCAMSDLDDEHLSTETTVGDIEQRLFPLLKTNKYDFIFSHGENGEYGHVRHMAVHFAVQQFIKQGKLICKKVYYFDYVPKDNFCVANPNSKLRISLSKEELAKKKDLITRHYGFQRGSFEEACVASVEAFKVDEH